MVSSIAIWNTCWSMILIISLEFFIEPCPMIASIYFISRLLYNLLETVERETKFDVYKIESQIFHKSKIYCEPSDLPI